MNTYLKYLKYKNKYLELKNQIGGLATNIKSTLELLARVLNEIQNNEDALIIFMNLDIKLLEAVVPIEGRFTKDNIKDSNIQKKILCAIISKIENKVYNIECLNKDVEKDEQLRITCNLSSNTLQYIKWIVTCYLNRNIANITAISQVMEDIKIFNEKIIKFKISDSKEPTIKEIKISDLQGYDKSLIATEIAKAEHDKAEREKAKRERAKRAHPESAHPESAHPKSAQPESAEPESAELFQWVEQFKWVKISNSNIKKLYLKDIIEKIDWFPLNAKVVQVHVMKTDQRQEIFDRTKVEEMPDATIYLPKTKEESITLGAKTHWCTATKTSNNMFDYYGKRAPLYIIVPKESIRSDEKYQLNEVIPEFDYQMQKIVDMREFMNEKDNIISYKDLLKRFSSEEFKTWMLNTFFMRIVKYNNKYENFPKKMQLYLSNMEDEMQSKIKKLYLDYLEPPSSYVEIKRAYSSLTHLILKNYNQRLDNSLPLTLEYLLLCDYQYDLDISILPPSLKILIIGGNSFRSITNSNTELLPNIQYITFGINFNESISPNTLPKSLKQLNLGIEYNKPIDENVLPKSLEELILSYEFNEVIDEGILPPTLKILIFGDKYNKPIKVLPPSLIDLEFGVDYNKPIIIQKDNPYIREKLLPDSLTHLIFGENYNYPIVHIEELDGEMKEDRKRELVLKLLPESLTHLTFGKNYNYPIVHIGEGILKLLPESLTHLTFGENYNYPIIHIGEGIVFKLLPESLTHLTFGKYFFEPLNGLPISLKELVLTYKYDVPINIEMLPRTLENLTISEKYKEYFQTKKVKTYISEHLPTLNINYINDPDSLEQESDDDEPIALHGALAEAIADINYITETDAKNIYMDDFCGLLEPRALKLYEKNARNINEEEEYRLEEARARMQASAIDRTIAQNEAIEAFRAEERARAEAEERAKAEAKVAEAATEAASRAISRARAEYLARILGSEKDPVTGEPILG